MNLEEARNILGVDQNAKENEVKSKYRELTKKFHPDLNKEDGAEDRFKRINEAYECVKNGKGSDPEPSEFAGVRYSDFRGSPFGGMPRRKQRTIKVEPIQENISISFKDAVWGCKREISFTRKVKCEVCGASGDIPINNGCTECGGTGVFVKRQGNMIFSQTCRKCMGKVDIQTCSNCNGDGLLDSTASVQITIPPGIQNGNVLRLGGMGHYLGEMMGFEQRTDALVIVHVEPDLGLSVDGMDVVSHLNISLLEALKGCTKSVKTLIGQKDIEIKPKTRHNDTINIPNLGVGRKGSQRVVLDVAYPDNISSIVDLLSKKDK